MPSALVPELNGRVLSVDAALRQPGIIQAQIARLADDVLLLPKFLHQLGAPVTGGGIPVPRRAGQRLLRLRCGDAYPRR